MKFIPKSKTININGERFRLYSKYPKSNLAETEMKHLKKDGFLVRIIPANNFYYLYKGKKKRPIGSNSWRKK